MEIGEKLRLLRKKRGYTLQQVAMETGYSASLISQVERDLVTPSIATLKKISQALEMPLFALFDEEKFQEFAKEDIIVRKDQRKRIQTDAQKAVFSLLVPNTKRKLEVIMIESEPGGKSGDDYHMHSGEECEYILQGTMEVEWDGDIYTIHEGETIYIDSSKPHRWRNPGPDKLVVLCALTPPEF